MAGGAHEIILALDAAELNPHRILREMLNEHPSHRTLRRGCGYTQATRFLSTYINQPRDPVDPSDLDLVADRMNARARLLAQQAIAAGWPLGWRNLDRCQIGWLADLRDSEPTRILHCLQPRLAEVAAGVQQEESQLFLRLLQQILAGDHAPTENLLPAMPEKPEIGSCSQAEEFFLEIAHGRIRRHGRVNIVVDAQGRPLLLEKMNLGESHSAIAIAEITLCGVTLPPGSLFALRWREPLDALSEAHCGSVLPVKGIEQARFLRLTTLTLPPNARRRAFSAQVEAQIQSDFLSPMTTTMEHLVGFAEHALAGA